MTSVAEPRTRGTTNGNARGNVEDRRRRRAYLMVVYASDVEGFVRCYRCGVLLFNPDDYPPDLSGWAPSHVPVDIGAYALPLTTDRIIPGCKGGTYRRNNIRPACAKDNSETGGALSGTSKKKGKR